MKFFKKATALLTAACLLAGCSSSASDSTTSESLVVSESDKSDVKIGIIQLVEHEALDAATEGFEDYLKDNGYADAQIDFNSAQGEVANCTTIAQKLVNNNVDLIYAVATQAALSAAQETKDIPIVISAVTDPESSGLVESNEKPGNNVTGSSDLNPITQQFDLLMELVPDCKTVGLIYCNAESNSEFQIGLAKEECDKLGLNYEVMSVTDSNQIQQAIESLNGKVDAIYVPTDNLLADSMVTVSQTAIQYGIPVITGEENMVANGGLATYGLNYYQLGQLAGKMAVSILNGESEPADMAIEYLPSEDCTLTINMKTAEALGLEIPQDILDKAVIVGEED